MLTRLMELIVSGQLKITNAYKEIALETISFHYYIFMIYLLNFI